MATKYLTRERLGIIINLFLSVVEGGTLLRLRFLAKMSDAAFRIRRFSTEFWTSFWFRKSTVDHWDKVVAIIIISFCLLTCTSFVAFRHKEVIESSATVSLNPSLFLFFHLVGSFFSIKLRDFVLKLFLAFPVH